MKLHRILAALVLAISIDASGQEPDAAALARLDGYALALTETDQFSGVVLVAHQGKVVFEKAYGLRDERTEDANTLTTRFNLASAGKMFTAVAVLQLVSEKKLSLDSPVGSVLRDYPNPAFAKVTVRQLLTHTAGAGDIDLFGVEHAENRGRVQSTADMMALHSTRAPAFSPGSQQVYGNFGHVVLGRMVEVLSGMDYERYITERIFKPAGMVNTAFVNCAETAASDAVGYVAVDGKRVTNCTTLPTRGFPAGGQMSTAVDMLRFVQSLQSGKLIPPDIFAQAITPQREYMGLGFFATGYGPGYPERDFRWGHGGSADGICTDIRTYPQTGETLIVLSNRDPPACFGVANLLHK